MQQEHTILGPVRASGNYGTHGQGEGSEMRRFRFGVVAALAAALTVAAIFPLFAGASAPGPAYLAVASFSAKAQHRNLAKVAVTANAAIPRHPDAFIRANPVVGFAWVDLATSKAFVVVIHPAIGRDSRQNPNGWHAHTVTLATGATAPHDFCLASIDSSPTAGIQLHGKTMRVNVRARALPFAVSAIDTAVGFTVQHDVACASGLAVVVST